MKRLSHSIDLQYQPTPTTCTQTALSMLISSYDQRILPVDLEQQVPQIKDEDGNDSGTLLHQAATWCVSQGYQVDLYSFDCQIIDQSWFDLDGDHIVQMLRTSIAEDAPDVKSLGVEWTLAYRQCYIDYLEAGGKLMIMPAATSELFRKLLKSGPVIVCLCSNILYGKGKVKNVAGKNVLDTINGRAWNHTIIIHGYNENGKLMVADPIDGYQEVAEERMIAAIAAAQFECDSMLFQINR